MIPRLSLAAALLLAAPAWGAPALTTVQDVLYKADGTPFNGIVVVSWTSFETADETAIPTHSFTAVIVNGNLRVQLVPNAGSTPPVNYQVTYNSDGRIQFQEAWSVPVSSQPLRIRDVRVSSSATATLVGAGTSVQESDVVGLIADLGARPLKGPAYAAGRVAVVDATGQLASVSGNSSDCVHVDGSSGSCGGDQPGFVDADAPSGIVDGANTVFTLSAAPDPPASLAVYRNGLLQKLSQDYTFTGRTVQFAANAAPQPGDTLLASYRLSTTGSSGAVQSFPPSQVLCAGTGGSTTATALGSLGACSIPAGLLLPGDRVEIRFDLALQGASAGFSFELHWGGATLAHRDAPAGETMVTGRAGAAVLSTGSQLSFQTWGAALPFSAGMASAADPYTNGLIIDFWGGLAQAGPALTLANYSVVRLP